MNNEKKDVVTPPPPQTLGKSVVTVEALLGRQFDPRVTAYRDALALQASLAYAEADKSKKNSRLQGSAFTKLFAGVFSNREGPKSKKGNGSVAAAPDKVSGPRPLYADLDPEVSRRREQAREKEAELLSVERRLLTIADDQEALLLYRSRYLPLVEDLRVRLAELSNLMAFEVTVNHAMPHVARDSARSEAEALSQTKREAVRASRFSEADEALEKARDVEHRARAREWPDRHVKYVKAVEKT